jgi:hypothetical protein
MMRRLLLGLALAAGATQARAQPIAARMPAPRACPVGAGSVERSIGGTLVYAGSVPGIPELCRITNNGEAGEYYMGVWRADWPGAGLAYPALRAVMHGGKGAEARFDTFAGPGLQWHGTIRNEGIETVTVAGRDLRALRLSHEREGFDGNGYHSVITVWKELRTGMYLKVEHRHIAGVEVPNIAWTAVRVTGIPG